MIKKIALGALAVLSCAVNGCYMLTPEDPLLEGKDLTPDDFAWDYMDITREYEFIGVPRIDCPKLESNLRTTGHCEPAKQPFGNTIQCHLSFPAKELEFGCLPGENIPMIYARLTWDDIALVELIREYSSCTIVAAGPVIGDPPRYPTDPGYKACLVNSPQTPGKLLGPKGQERPAGLYFDLFDNPRNLQELTAQANIKLLNAPVSLVLDTRLLPEKERAEAMDSLMLLFSIYRRLIIPKTLDALE